MFSNKIGKPSGVLRRNTIILVDRVEDTETTRGISMNDIFNLKDALEDALGIEVDVTTPNGIKEYFRDEIVGMAEPI